MTIDFSVIKELIGGWIDECWDHRTILNSKDPLVPILIAQADTEGSERPYVMQGNPTAENLAAHLLRISNRLITEAARQQAELRCLRVVEVRLYETPNCWADVSAETGDNTNLA